MRAADGGAVRGLEGEPVADELLDLDLDVEQSAQEAFQPRGGFRLRPDQSGEGELAGIGDGIEIAIGPRPDADHRADIGDKAVVFGTVVLRHRTRIGPRTEEQLQESVVEQVEEARERVVPHQHPFHAFLGRREREGALRTEHAEEFDVDAQASAVRDGHARQIGSRKLHVGILAEVDVILAHCGAVADPRLVGIGALELAHHGKEIEAPGLLLHLVDQRHSGLRVPMRTGHRMIWPRSVV